MSCARNAPARSQASASLPRTPPEGPVARVPRPVTFGPDWLGARLAELLPNAAPLAVAFSGGADSTALLAALAALPQWRGQLRALHVNHGLHPQAPAWERHCRRTARALGVPFAVR
ncbi:MAG: hypothetical protein JO341_08170, partial [Gammaproteobacteria bacterium]|nr:hypothetical protein [Gammaproteobacteria bacterium]